MLFYSYVVQMYASSVCFLHAYLAARSACYFIWYPFSLFVKAVLNIALYSIQYNLQEFWQNRCHYYICYPCKSQKWHQGKDNSTTQLVFFLSFTQLLKTTSFSVLVLIWDNPSFKVITTPYCQRNSYCICVPGSQHMATTHPRSSQRGGRHGWRVGRASSRHGDQAGLAKDDGLTCWNNGKMACSYEIKYPVEMVEEAYNIDI